MVARQSDLGVIAYGVEFDDEPDYHAVGQQSDHRVIAFRVGFFGEPG